MYAGKMYYKISHREVVVVVDDDDDDDFDKATQSYENQKLLKL